MFSFPNVEPVHCSMFGFNCCSLTCIQISQEAGKVVWCPHILKKNFPQYIMIHTVKGFAVVNKAEVDVFLELSCFFYDLMDVGNLISGSSAFSKSNWTSGGSQFTYCWSHAWRILSITLRSPKHYWFHCIVSTNLPVHLLSLRTRIVSLTHEDAVDRQAVHAIYWAFYKTLFNKHMYECKVIN